MIVPDDLLYSKNNACFYEPVHVVQLTENIVEIRFKPESLHARILHGLGQYCKLCCSNSLSKPFSVTNVPNEIGTIDIHVRLSVRNKEMIANITKNGRALISGPFGKPYIPNPEIPSIFIAEGLGVAAHKPVFDFFKHSNGLPTKLIWYVTEKDTDYLKDTFIDWERSYPNFSIFKETRVADILERCLMFKKQFVKIHCYFAGSRYLQEKLLSYFSDHFQSEEVKFFSDV
ncbi:MAG: hypothetical protein DHS20C10_07680 [marine bacterium B5-7]|nr:MAG: hypothetical protein DHS20C10_07680 [marine bacterium B5-7]